MKKRNILMTLALGLTLVFSVIAKIQPPSISAEEPEEEPEFEYYRITSGYFEIQPYKVGKGKNAPITYGIPSTLGKKADSFVGKGKSSAKSLKTTMEEWGNHGVVDGETIQLMKEMPDGAEVVGVEWSAPFVEGSVLPNGEVVRDPYNIVKEYYEKYFDNRGKHLPQPISFAQKPAIIIGEDSGFLPMWEQQASLKTPLMFSTPTPGKSELIKPTTRSYRNNALEVDARKPNIIEGANDDGDHWTMANEASKYMFWEAKEIRAHYLHGHGVLIPYDATPEYLQNLNLCKIELRSNPLTPHVKEWYCSNGKEPDVGFENVNGYDNPSRVAGKPIEINADLTTGLSERALQYYRQMPSGSFQSSVFHYGTRSTSSVPKQSWRKQWSIFYIVPSSKVSVQNQTFADIFNGTFDSTRDLYRTYAPIITKFKVKIPPKNLKMPGKKENGIDPNNAVWNGQTSSLDVRAIAVMDKNHKKEELVESNIKIQIKNESFPNQNLNEFNGFYNDKKFKLKEYQVMNSHVADLSGGAGMTFTTATNLTKFDIKQTDKEQILHIRMEVNSAKDPTEEDYKDNVWEKKVRIPANKVDLIAVDIVQGITQPTPDWNTINTNITGKTRAVNTKDDESFLNKYPRSPVDMEIFIDGVKREDLSKRYYHELDKSVYSPSLKLSLPNNYQTKPSYKVKIKLTINKNKNTPLNEVTYENNSIEKEFIIPTISKPYPTPSIPTPTIPNLKLPWYDEEEYQCYLPKNPKTGQESMVLYDIGTTTHVHKADAIKWIGAPDNEIPPIEATKHLNWGKPGGWNEVKVYGPTCPDEDDDPYQLCLDYVKANQQATGFTWWNTDTFQQTRGTEVENWPTNSIPRLTIRPVDPPHLSDIPCYSNCCTDGKNSLHSHSYEPRTGTDSDGNSYSYSVRVCGDSSTPHYHWHTDYEVWKKTDVNLTGNIQVFQGTSNTKDHATQKNWTRSGYGIYSTLQYNYKTELEKGTLCSECKGDAEAWLFMPHLNKELPHRIVELDGAGTDGNKMFPKAFQTAKNPKAMYSQRKQFIDIDYPDKVMQLNFRYRLLAPGFEPTNHPTPTQIGLKNKYSTSRPALGNCTGGRIKVEGNMWDDVWVHPDDPNGVRP